MSSERHFEHDWRSTVDGQQGNGWVVGRHFATPVPRRRRTPRWLAWVLTRLSRLV